MEGIAGSNKNCCKDLRGIGSSTYISPLKMSGPVARFTYLLATFLCKILLLLGMDIESNPGPVKGLSLVHMNIQSLYLTSNHPRVKMDEIITTYVNEKEVDFICMSESWLHDGISDDLILLPGYDKPYRKDRKDRRGGGVVAYLTDNIVGKRLKDLEPADIDLMWIELNMSNKKVIVGVGYRPPKQNRAEVDQFMDQFATSLNKVMDRGAESIIVLGDFNDTCLIWDSVHTNSDLKNDFYDLISISDMVQLVSEPTHFSDTSESLIDLIITDSPGYVSKV
jgi:hypothetical protein